MAATYTFGDSELAGDRLDVVARVFAPTTRAFLWAEAPRACRLAVDVGCGPGHTTRLLGQVTSAERVVGLDASAAYVTRARRSEGPEAFVRHDATVVPWPTPALASDVVFCRYLLAHLDDASGALGAWATQARAGARILVEEVEAIDTDVDVFTRYLGIVTELLASRGQRLDIGRELHRSDDPAGLRRVSSRVAILQPPASGVVAMFRPNLATWRVDPVIAARYSPGELDDLDAALAAQADRPAGAITWRLRQMAWTVDAGVVD